MKHLGLRYFSKNQKVRYIDLSVRLAYNKSTERRLAYVNHNYSILPADITLEEAREERLKKYYD